MVLVVSGNVASVGDGLGVSNWIRLSILDVSSPSSLEIGGVVAIRGGKEKIDGISPMDFRRRNAS